INLWASQPTPAAVQVLTELTERSLHECPEGLCSIHWLDQSVGLPSTEVRVALGEVARRYQSHLICVGVVRQGSGFWASATRSALTGIMLLAPRTTPLRFFGDAPEVAAFVQRLRRERGSNAGDVEELMRAISDALNAFERAPG